MNEKAFQNPTDQGWHQVESKIIAWVFGLDTLRITWISATYLCQARVGLSVAAMILVSLFACLLGAVIHIRDRTQWPGDENRGKLDSDIGFRSAVFS